MGRGLAREREQLLKLPQSFRLNRVRDQTHEHRLTAIKELLAQHPEAHVEVITSRSEEGLCVADMYPNLRGHYDLAFSEPDPAVLAECDLVFFATALHGTASISPSR